MNPENKPLRLERVSVRAVRLEAVLSSTSSAAANDAKNGGGQ
jgi:hypothetical protein